MPEQAKQRVCVGVIAGPHGVRGDVKVAAFTENPEGLTAYGPLGDKAGCRVFDLKILRVTHKHVVCRIAGIGDRDAADVLRGMELYVDRDRLPEVEDGVWYHSDLEGLAVLDPDNVRVGQVRAVQNYGAGDLLEIDMANSGASVLIIFNRENVPDVDIVNGTIRLAKRFGDLTGE